MVSLRRLISELIDTTDTTNMKEITKNLMYEDVGRNQITLTEKEEIELITEYQTKRTELHLYLLNKAECRAWLYSEFDRIKEEGKAVTKLSSNQNKKESGHNTKLEKVLEVQLGPNNREVSANYLYSIGLSEYCYVEMAKLWKKDSYVMKTQEAIKEIETTLLCSMLMAAQEIAKKYSYSFLNIDFYDAAQEANIGLLDSIRRYDPGFQTPQGNRIKLITYCYGRTEKLVKEWVLMHSRLVRVPRSRMDRILIMLRAYDRIQSVDLNIATLTELSNEILREKDNIKHELFTYDEVDELLKILLGSCIQLDTPVQDGDKPSKYTTIGDFLINTEPNAVDELSDREDKQQLFDILSSTLTELELDVIKMRYFHTTQHRTPKNLALVGDILKKKYNRMFSRESVRLIEVSALEKLRNIKEMQDLW